MEIRFVLQLRWTQNLRRIYPNFGWTVYLSSDLRWSLLLQNSARNQKLLEKTVTIVSTWRENHLYIKITSFFEIKTTCHLWHFKVLGRASSRGVTELAHDMKLNTLQLVGHNLAGISLQNDFTKKLLSQFYLVCIQNNITVVLILVCLVFVWKF